MAANLSLRQSQPLGDDQKVAVPLTVIFEDDDLLVTQYIPASRSMAEEEWHMFGAFGSLKPFALRLAQSRCANAVFYIPKKNIWYQTSPMEEIIEQARSSMKRKQKTKVINYGSSMGGFAACAFAKFTKAQLVIAAAPQISISQSVVGEHDQRWADIAGTLEHKFPDACLGLEKAPRVAIIYDPFVAEDLWHAEQMRAKAKVELIPFEFGGHAVLHTLKEAGILRPLVESIVTGSDVAPFQEKYKQVTAQSFGYWMAKSRWHMVKQDLDMAEQGLKEALTRVGPTDQAYTLLADICRERGQLAESARYALLALKGAPNLASLYIKAAEALDRTGESAEAETLLHKCLETHRDNADACSILADFAYRRGDIDGAIAYMKRATMGRMGISPWHKVLSDLYSTNGDMPRAAHQLRLAQKPYSEPAPKAPPLYPMYQDGIHPISLGVRADRWCKTIKFNFLELPNSSPCDGTWSIEAAGAVAAEDFSEASVIKRDFYRSGHSFEIIAGKAGYVAIDLPDSFINGQPVLISVSTVENSTISFVLNDESYTPLFDAKGIYIHKTTSANCKLSVLVQRINSRLPALVKVDIALNQSAHDAGRTFLLENYWITRNPDEERVKGFYNDPASGLGEVRFLMHCEKASEQELTEKIMKWEEAPPPKLKYMVFFMPRSGSTLLCQILAKSGIFGSAHELYIPPNFHPLYRMLDCDNASEYIDRIERVFQSPHGVFGTEIDWDRYQIYWRYYLESRMDGYVKFYLDRKDFLSHFISQFYASVANVWFDINGSAQPDRDIPEDLNEENISQVFSFLLRQKLAWSRYLHGRKDVKRIYFEDIMSRTGMKEIFADLLPDTTLWPRVQKEWQSYYEDTFFVPGSPKGKRSLQGKIFEFLKLTTMVTRSDNDVHVAFPDFLEEYAADILEAVQRGINLAPFVRVGPSTMWTYAE
jgi:LPS sulfotransferase NodH/tetratricopeptide (TPR) repeat protein